MHRKGDTPERGGRRHAVDRHGQIRFARECEALQCGQRLTEEQWCDSDCAPREMRPHRRVTSKKEES